MNKVENLLMRILLVEDNPRLTELITEGLASAGFVTDMASNIRDAESFLRGILSAKHGL